MGYGYVVPVNTTFYNNLTTSELFAQLVQIANETYSPAVENFRSTYNIKTNQAHFDALTSFVFNCGVGTLSSDYGFRRALLNAVDVSGFSGSATGTVNVDDVDLGAAPVYSSASTASQQVTTLDIGATVTVTSVSSTRTSTKQEVWYQVTTSGGQVGWMPGRLCPALRQLDPGFGLGRLHRAGQQFPPVEQGRRCGGGPGVAPPGGVQDFLLRQLRRGLPLQRQLLLQHLRLPLPEECEQYDRRQ